MSVAPLTLNRVAERSLAVPRLGASARMGAVLLASLVFINEAVFRDADVEQFSFDWQVALRLALCAACGLYGAIHWRKSIGILLSGPGLLVETFGSWALVTVPTAMSPFYAGAACAAFWCVLLFVAAIRRELDDDVILKAVIASLLLFLAASWVVYYAFPPFGHVLQVLPGGEIIDRFGGLTHPNSLGRQATLTIALLLAAGYLKLARWPLLWPPMMFAGLTVIATDSRTALVSCIAVVATALARSLPAKQLLAGLFLGVPLVAALLVVGLAADWIHFDFESFLAGVSRSGDTGEIYSMTGRTEAWAFAWDRFAESPLLGYGHGCARFIMEHNFFPTHHAHNLLLNTLLTTGIMGGLLLLMQFGLLAARMWGRFDPFPNLLFVAVLVGGLADAVMLGPIPDSHTVLWLLALFWTAKPTHSRAQSTVAFQSTHASPEEHA